MSTSCDTYASRVCAGPPAVAAITAAATPAPTPLPRNDACGGAQELLKKYLSASPCVFVRGQAGVQATYSGTDATSSHSWSYPGAIVHLGVTPTSQITVVVPSQSGVTNATTGSAIGASDMEFRFKQLAYVDRVHGILGGLLLTYESPTGSPGLAAPGPSYQINPLLNIALNRARSIGENLSFPVTNAPAPAGRTWSLSPQAVTFWRSPGGTLLAIVVQYGFSSHASYLTLNTAQLISRNFQLQGTFGGNSMPINYDSPIQDVDAAKNGTYSHSFTIGVSYMMGTSELPQP